MKTLSVLALALCLAGCATFPSEPRAAAADGSVNVNVLPPATITFVCHGQAGCSEQVYYDGAPKVITVWCSADHDVLACVAHELSHIARRSSAHLN